MKSVIITGASRGIGQAIALRYAREGYHVSICCRHNLPQLQQVQAQIESYGVRCLAYCGDMGSFEQAATFISMAVEQFGIPDVLVNNAGISYIGLLQDMSTEEWNHIIQTNLSSVFHCSKLVISQMLHEKKGKIINISSVWGNVGASMEVAYSTTKGGINAFTKALAKELAPSGIQVNAVACGIIDTDMNAFLSPEDLDAVLEEVPTGRLGRPDEVADLVYDLTQNKEYLTGQIITIDGGWI